MRTDKELQKILVEKTTNYRDTLPVFKIRNQNASELHNEAVKLALPFTDTSQVKELRFDWVQKENHTLLRLQNNATLQYYPISGFKCFQKNTPEYLNSISNDAKDIKREEFEKAASDILEKNRLNLSGTMESLCFENLFLLKSAGITPEGKATPVVLNRLVYAYRRYVNEMPVLGSASVFIKTAANYELDSFGIDWRYLYDAPLTRATIISPEDAATMVLEQLQNTNPERVYSTKNVEPLSFELGYFSHSKTTYQTVLQPVYVAKFILNGTSRMGHIVAVPAASTSYESICRKVTPPPFNSDRRDLKYSGNKMRPYTSVSSKSNFTDTQSSKGC